MPHKMCVRACVCVGVCLGECFCELELNKVSDDRFPPVKLKSSKNLAKRHIDNNLAITNLAKTH